MNSPPPLYAEQASHHHTAHALHCSHSSAPPTSPQPVHTTSSTDELWIMSRYSPATDGLKEVDVDHTQDREKRRLMH